MKNNSCELLLELAEKIIEQLPPNVNAKYFKLKASIVQQFPKVETVNQGQQVDEIVLNSPFKQEQIKAETEKIMQEAKFTQTTEIITPTIQLNELQHIEESIQTEPILQFKSIQTDIVEYYEKSVECEEIQTQNQFTQTNPDQNSQVNNILHQILKKYAKCEEIESIPNQLIKLNDILELGSVNKKKLEKLQVKQKSNEQLMQDAKKYIEQQQIELDNSRSIVAQNEGMEKKMQLNLNEIANLKIKMEETDTLFQKCQNAYFNSLSTLKQHAEEHINKLQSQLAVIFDQMRRMRKIDSFDEDMKSVFESILANE